MPSETLKIKETQYDHHRNRCGWLYRQQSSSKPSTNAALPTCRRRQPDPWRKNLKNLAECEIAHYLDKHEFIRQVRGHLLPYENIEAVFHQGACSDTMNHDGLYMMDNNYQYTLDLLDWCQDERIPFLYASSAAVYGKGEIFREERELEKPLNV